MGAAVVFLILCAGTTVRGQHAPAAGFGLMAFLSAIVAVLAPRIESFSATRKGITIAAHPAPETPEAPVPDDHNRRRAVLAGVLAFLFFLGGAAAANRGRNHNPPPPDRGARSQLSSWMPRMVPVSTTTRELPIDPRRLGSGSVWNTRGPAIDDVDPTQTEGVRWSRVHGSDTGRFVYFFSIRSAPLRPATFSARLSSDEAAPSASPETDQSVRIWSSDVVLIVNGHASPSVNVAARSSQPVGGSLYIWSVSPEQFREGDNSLSLVVPEKAAHRNGLSVYFSSDERSIVDGPRLALPSSSAEKQTLDHLSARDGATVGADMSPTSVVSPLPLEAMDDPRRSRARLTGETAFSVSGGNGSDVTSVVRPGWGWSRPAGPPGAHGS